MEDYDFSWDELNDYEPYNVTYLDLDLSPEEVVERFYTDISDRTVAEDDWLAEVLPKLDISDIQEILEDFDQVEDCVKAMSIRELAEDLVAVDAYDEDELDDMFESAFEDEINKYLEEPNDD